MEWYRVLYVDADNFVKVHITMEEDEAAAAFDTYKEHPDCITVLTVEVHRFDY